MAADQFKQSIDSAIEQKADLSIASYSTDDTIYGLGKLYKQAEESIYIFTGNLRDDFFSSSDIVNSIKEFLDKGDSKLNIFFKDNEFQSFWWEDKPLLAMIASNKIYSQKTSFFTSTAKPIINCESNFSVVDKKYYRLSKDKFALWLQPRNISQILGVFNFGDPVEANEAVVFFEKVIKHSASNKILIPAEYKYFEVPEELAI